MFFFFFTKLFPSIIFLFCAWFIKVAPINKCCLLSTVLSQYIFLNLTSRPSGVFLSVLFCLWLEGWKWVWSPVESWWTVLRENRYVIIYKWWLYFSTCFYKAHGHTYFLNMIQNPEMPLNRVHSASLNVWSMHSGRIPFHLSANDTGTARGSPPRAVPSAAYCRTWRLVLLSIWVIYWVTPVGV